MLDEQLALGVLQEAGGNFDPDLVLQQPLPGFKPLRLFLDKVAD